MPRHAYDCPCGYTWATRTPMGTLTNPYSPCPKCGTKSAPYGSLAWRDSVCESCGTGEGEMIVSEHGRLCKLCHEAKVNEIGAG